MPIPSMAAGPSARCARRISHRVASVVAIVSNYGSVVVVDQKATATKVDD